MVAGRRVREVDDADEKDRGADPPQEHGRPETTLVEDFPHDGVKGFDLTHG